MALSRGSKERGPPKWYDRPRPADVHVSQEEWEWFCYTTRYAREAKLQSETSITPDKSSREDESDEES